MDLVAPHLDRALAAALGRRPLGREAVHEIRRELRRARAGLRLVRDSVGPRAYSGENRRLRDAGRVLAAVRDADVAVRTIETLLQRDLDAGDGRWLRALRATVRHEAATLRPQLAGKRIDGLVREVRETAADVANWRLPADPRPVLANGLRRIYRNGRRALGEVEARPTDRGLHELRKHVKFLAAALRLSKASGLRTERGMARRADALSRRLGADRDLAELRRRFGGASRSLVAEVARRRAKLQRGALKKARTLYGRRAADFAAGLS